MCTFNSHIVHGRYVELRHSRNIPVLLDPFLPSHVLDASLKLRLDCPWIASEVGHPQTTTPNTWRFEWLLTFAHECMFKISLPTVHICPWMHVQVYLDRVKLTPTEQIWANHLTIEICFNEACWNTPILLRIPSFACACTWIWPPNNSWPERSFLLGAVAAYDGLIAENVSCNASFSPCLCRQQAIIFQ